MKQFLSISEAAEEIGASEQYIRNLIDGIKANTPERYTPSDVFNGGKVAVRFVALQDYARYRDRIKGRSPVILPPYEPVARETELGIAPQKIIQKGEAEMLAKAVVGELIKMMRGAYGNTAS